MEAKLNELRERLAEVSDLKAAAALLTWDLSTYMPPGGAAARGRQLATLGRLSHQKFTAVEIGRLLDDLRAYEESQPVDSTDAALIRVTRRDYERAVRMPSEFVAKLEAHRTATFQVWTEARPANDFGRVAPYVEKMVELAREFANFFPGYERIADPLIDLVDEGMKSSSIQAVFAELRRELVPLVKQIAERPLADDAALHGHFPEAQQLTFGLGVAQKFGYDLNRGRQDKTHHPFATKFSIGDVRITTRVHEDDMSSALFSTLHESGHAMYEQGVSPDLEATTLDGGASAGVHESQSRLWENIVGRSLGFWEHFYPQLQAVFPEQLGEVQLETFYRAINRVRPSLIRTEADEVTYNLHVMIRFDLELSLLEGRLAVRDLPEAWNERYRTDLGVTPPDDRDGVLQDTHWYSWIVGGAFQGYTLGNIMSALFYSAALEAQPDIPAQIRAGDFSALHNWLRENLYRHGRKYTPNQLLQRITGGPLRIEPYVRYLKAKYGELYGLSG